MRAILIIFRHDIEEEGRNIEVKCLVVQEKLSKKAEVLTIKLRFEAVDFVDRDGCLAIFGLLIEERISIKID